MCEDCGKKRPHYGLTDMGKPQWCADCAKGQEGETERIHKNKMCEGCKKHRPSYARPAERKVRWCVACGPNHNAIFWSLPSRTHALAQGRASAGQPVFRGLHEGSLGDAANGLALAAAIGQGKLCLGEQRLAPGGRFCAADGSSRKNPRASTVGSSGPRKRKVL